MDAGCSTREGRLCFLRVDVVTKHETIRGPVASGASPAGHLAPSVCPVILRRPSFPQRATRVRPLLLDLREFHSLFDLFKEPAWLHSAPGTVGRHSLSRCLIRACIFPRPEDYGDLDVMLTPPPVMLHCLLDLQAWMTPPEASPLPTTVKRVRRTLVNGPFCPPMSAWGSGTGRPEDEGAGGPQEGAPAMPSADRQ